MYRSRGEWRDEGSAESGLSAALPPVRHIALNTKTGQRRTVLINVGQTFGEAVSLGQWADSSGAVETHPRVEHRKEPRDVPKSPKERSRRKESRTGSTSGSSSGGGGAFAGYVVAAVVFGLSGLMAEWAFNHNHMVLWGIGLVICLATAYWALQVILVLFGAILALCVLYYVPKEVYEKVQADKAAETRLSAEIAADNQHRTRVRAAAQRIVFVVPQLTNPKDIGDAKYLLGRLTRDDLVLVEPLGGRIARIGLGLGDPLPNQRPKAIDYRGQLIGYGSGGMVGFQFESPQGATLEVHRIATGYPWTAGEAREGIMAVSVNDQAYRVTIYCAVGAPNPPCDYR